MQSQQQNITNLLKTDSDLNAITRLNVIGEVLKGNDRALIDILPIECIVNLLSSLNNKHTLGYSSKSALVKWVLQYGNNKQKNVITTEYISNLLNEQELDTQDIYNIIIPILKSGICNALENTQNAVIIKLLNLDTQCQNSLNTFLQQIRAQHNIHSQADFENLIQHSNNVIIPFFKKTADLIVAHAQAQTFTENPAPESSQMIQQVYRFR